MYKVSSLAHTVWACAVYMCNACAAAGWWAVSQTPVSKQARLPCMSQYTSCCRGFAGARAGARSIRPSIVGATSTEVDPTPLLSLAIDTSDSDFPTCVLAGCGSEIMYDFWPRRRALESHTNASHTTAGVERELERGYDRKEHVCVSDYGEKFWPPTFARE